MYYIVLSYQKLKKYFLELKKGDLIAIRIPFKDEEKLLIVDLMTRGVEAYPSFLSQILCSSKTLQAEVLREFMLPFTRVVRDKHSLLMIMQEYKENSIEGAVITKEDKANCGLGVRLWDNIEQVFNFAGTDVLQFPFVIQPFYENLKDIRVIILGDKYIEAYQRKNPYNFRQNIFFGGKSIPYELSKEELEFCKKVMKRGGFPHAHIDLVYIENQGPYISEINLKGGIKGAKISTEEYEKILKELRDEFIKKWEKTFQPIKYLTL
ncbi:MAG: hypothetical protein GXO57_08180 [Thermodesulfobacteria bacterium]|nr:hypothetical protein [Thermodesulfobacteriota bacterium]